MLLFSELSTTTSADEPGNMKNAKTLAAPLLREFLSIVFGNVCDIFRKFLVQEFNSSHCNSSKLS